MNENSNVIHSLFPNRSIKKIALFGEKSKWKNEKKNSILFYNVIHEKSSLFFIVGIELMDSESSMCTKHFL